ncbi:MAG: hypothetical protein ACK5MW_05885 [Enterococcus sp.]
MEPFDRILCGYKKLVGIAVSIRTCSQLVGKYRKYGVTGYLVGDFRGLGYLQRQTVFSLERVPMLVYQEKYLIPLVFRAQDETKRLFVEHYRMQAFFLLLDWYLTYQPEKVILQSTFEKKATILPQYSTKESYQIVDNVYLALRLTEILEGAGYPLSRLQRLTEFIAWNQEHQLVVANKMGRHSPLFDPTNPKQCSELRMIQKLIQLKYPRFCFFYE